MSSSYTDPTIDEIFQLNDTAPQAIDIEPVWSNKKLTKSKGDYEALREWLTSTHESQHDVARQRATCQIKNLALWLGLHYQSQTATGDFLNSDDDDVTVDSHKVIINNIYDIERNRFSKITRNIPQTRVVARKTGYEGYRGARIGQAVLESAKERCQQQDICSEALRESFIFGESWLFPHWNPDKGKIHPVWERLYKSNRNPRSIRIDGEVYEYDPDIPMYIGDHDLRTILPWNNFVEPQVRPRDVGWCYEVKYIHCDVAKALWPKKASKIKPEENAKVFDLNNLTVQNLQNHVLVYYFYHRSCKFLKDGIYFAMTPGLMLEEPDDNPYRVVEESEWGNLPRERLTDIDVPGRLHAYSTIQILANLQHSENQMHTMVKHFLLLMGEPKMLIPGEGKINIEQFSDDSMYITYYGGAGNKPELMVPNPVPPQVVAFAELLRDRMQKLGDLHGVSSGDLPKNVRAARAISMLQELEDLRSTAIFKKYNGLYLALDRKILAQTENYRPSDERLITMFGQGNEYLVEDFDAEVFADNYTVAPEIQGMLPQQPTARAEFILNAQQMSSNTLFAPEKLAKLLGFQDQKEFIDHATVSVVKAQRENDFFIKNRKIDSPQPHENHLIELREHFVLLQSATFELLPGKIQEKIISHVRAHEYLHWLDMQESPAMLQYTMMNAPWFPKVFKQPKAIMAPQGMGQPGQQPQGQATPGGQQQQQPQAAAG